MGNMLWLLQRFLLALVDGRRGYCACCALILHGIGDREACAAESPMAAESLLLGGPLVMALESPMGCL